MKRCGSSISKEQGRALMNYKLRADDTLPDTLEAGFHAQIKGSRLNIGLQFTGISISVRGA